MTPGRRHLAAGELADVYASIAATRPDLDVATPVVALVGAPLAPTTLTWLRQFGVDVHSLPGTTLPPGAYAVGGGLPPSMVPGEGAGLDDEVMAVVLRARLREWAGDTVPEPTFTTLHRPGSDSRGVVQFRFEDRDIVAKTGAREAIEGEARFATQVNSLLAREGRRGLFPTVHGVRAEHERAVSLMEAGEPLQIAPLFADEARTVLADEAAAVLEPHLELLGAWYRLTADTRPPTVADYLYRERYHALPADADFVATFRSFFGDLPMEDLFAVPVHLPGEVVVPGYREAVGWLDEVTPQLLPRHGSAVHGDIYAANMLLRVDGTPMLIDPRTVWEGRDRPDVGYGDPVFDLATLLHGVLPMAAVLHASEAGTIRDLVGGAVRPAPDALDLSAARLPTDFPPAVRALEDRMLRALPRADRHAQVRLYIGAATSLLGWLKYGRSLRTPEAWLATYAFVVWYLRRARELWEKNRCLREAGS